MSGICARILPWLLLGAVLTVVCGAISYAILASQKLSDGPADIVWDKTACSACGMHVGEPGFAAQLTTKSGTIHAFDDPGCLFLFVEERRPEVHTIFFHHSRESRWLAIDTAAFVRVGKSPMGFGIAAVDPGTADSLTVGEARRLCLERTAVHGGK